MEECLTVRGAEMWSSTPSLSSPLHWPRHWSCWPTVCGDHDSHQRRWVCYILHCFTHMCIHTHKTITHNTPTKFLMLHLYVYSTVVLDIKQSLFLLATVQCSWRERGSQSGLSWRRSRTDPLQTYGSQTSYTRRRTGTTHSASPPSAPKRTLQLSGEKN